MSIINAHQSNLHLQKFRSVSLSDAFRIEAKPSSDEGSILDITTGTSHKYRLTSKEATIFIESEYFQGKFIMATTPVGIELLDSTQHVRHKYINEFWIDNQHIINKILEHLVKLKDTERLFGVDELALSAGDLFSITANWTERLEITERIMEMLIQDSTVGKGTVHGKLRISFTSQTEKKLMNNLYVWP